jgi:hypothetical protein
MSRFDLHSPIGAPQIWRMGLPIWQSNANPNPRVFAMQKLERASDQECLRLMLAFFRIEDPAQRLRLITLAEWFAADSSVGPCESTAPIMQDNHTQIRRRT